MKNQFSLFTDLIGEALALLCAFVLFFGYPNPAFATEIDTIGGVSSSIFAYKTYQKLAASKTNKELEERIENLETIVTKD